jgi:N-acetylmuramoyl-L-alanine amidase
MPPPPAAPISDGKSVFIAYPPATHETTADRIFLIGTAPLGGDVQVNGQPIRRSPVGHFAPSVPLQMGLNALRVSYGSQEVVIRVTRVLAGPPEPRGLVLPPEGLSPQRDVARMAGEWVCFGAVADPQGTVQVRLGQQTIPLLPDLSQGALPENAAALTEQNQPVKATKGRFRGCTKSLPTGNLGKPEFQLTLGGQTLTQVGAGQVEIWPSERVAVAEVTAANGAARTGPSTDYSRLTPLPKGARSQVSGTEGDWVRLQYGPAQSVWMRRSEVQLLPTAAPLQSVIRSVVARPAGNWTDVRFPLEVAVPIQVQQTRQTLTLTLYNTTAQTDTIRFDADPAVEWLDWQQVAPGQVQYTLHMKTDQQWGYRLRYEGTTLVLSVKHPPRRAGGTRPLTGITVLLDAGHGGPEDLGARGPNGYPEKDVALTISTLVQRALEQRGAKVVMTRTQDVDLTLADRVAQINQTQNGPLEATLVLSLHYNALPDNGDAENTAGIGTFWYQPQSHDLAMFLQQYLVKALNRPSYGVFWNNLALTRPAVAPTVLLELGFMIHPTEFEWIVDAREQERLAGAIANGVAEWLRKKGQP